ncbi:hypothetical protein I302_107735 [Kwoniella bestiolae CBS 10118]|uniref:Uncharacterized protein n=1 Tax=Kwoniella bestiolae CBS 10118 TaxID=1296100 RepID=A0A1B9FXN8_9TREE|nr:hypothetical protein I302_06526 [Kwoniella bestiolae CBS 10118]OCF23543.1 hypothetical protein I302_06526 [Kwoniella bestiolae CBS 10118]
MSSHQSAIGSQMSAEAEERLAAREAEMLKTHNTHAMLIRKKGEGNRQAKRDLKVFKQKQELYKMTKSSSGYEEDTRNTFVRGFLDYRDLMCEKYSGTTNDTKGSTADSSNASTRHSIREWFLGRFSTGGSKTE